MHENRTSYPKRKAQMYQQLLELPKKYKVLALIKMNKVRSTQILEHPELINQSPYEEGWIVKIKPSNPEQIDSLLSKEQYDELVGQSKE